MLELLLRVLHYTLCSVVFLKCLPLSKKQALLRKNNKNLVFCVRRNAAGFYLDMLTELLGMKF